MFLINFTGDKICSQTKTTTGRKRSAPVSMSPNKQQQSTHIINLFCFLVCVEKNTMFFRRHLLGQFPPFLLFRLLQLPFLLLLLCSWPTSSAGYKILIYSQTLTRSHVILNARVAETLAADGHNVTILEVEYLEPLANFSGSQAKGVRKIMVGEGTVDETERSKLQKQLVIDTLKGPLYWAIQAGTDRAFHESLNVACEDFLDKEGELLAQLRAEKFDLFIGEQINFCGSALSHVMDIPVHVLLVSCPIQEHVAALLGLPFPTSYVPSLYGVPYMDKMGIGQRLVNWLCATVWGDSFLYGIDHLTAIFRRRFGPDFPHVRDIVKESPLVLVNVDELVDFPRPIFPNVVYIGGLEFEARAANSPAKPPSPPLLEEPFRTVMDTQGRRGVVFFSLGSAVNTAYLPEQFRRNMFTAFAQLADWHFLVKVSDADALSRELAQEVPNVFLTGWAPQRAILGHPRMRLFISHGGYNSLIETALAGCPVLGMGFFADQMRNALVPERNGWGLGFDKAELLEGHESFREAVLTLLEEPRSREGAARLKQLLATKPFTAREHLTRHIRFLEQNGGKLPELMAESRNMSTMALYNLDLIGLALLCLAVSLLALYWLCRIVWRLCRWAWQRLLLAAERRKSKAE